MKAPVAPFVVLLPLLPGCIECDCSHPTAGFCHNLCFGPAETSGYDEGDVDHGHLACSFDGKCILDIDPDDPIIQEAQLRSRRCRRRRQPVRPLRRVEQHGHL